MSIIWRLFVVVVIGLMAFGGYSYLQRPPPDEVCGSAQISTHVYIDSFIPTNLKLIRVFSTITHNNQALVACATTAPFDLHLTGKIDRGFLEVRYLSSGNQIGEPYRYMDLGLITKADAEVLKVEKEAMIRAILSEKPFQEVDAYQTAARNIPSTARKFDFSKLQGFAVMVGPKRIVRGEFDRLIASDGTRLPRKLDGLTVVFK